MWSEVCQRPGRRPPRPLYVCGLSTLSVWEIIHLWNLHFLFLLLPFHHRWVLFTIIYLGPSFHALNIVLLICNQLLSCIWYMFICLSNQKRCIYIQRYSRGLHSVCFALQFVLFIYKWVSLCAFDWWIFQPNNYVNNYSIHHLILVCSSFPPNHRNISVWLLTNRVC